MIKMKLFVFLFCVILALVITSADEAPPNACYQEKMKPIEDAAVNFEGNDDLYAGLKSLAENSAKAICATFEEKLENLKKN